MEKWYWEKAYRGAPDDKYFVVTADHKPVVLYYMPKAIAKALAKAHNDQLPQGAAQAAA